MMLKSMLTFLKKGSADKKACTNIWKYLKNKYVLYSLVSSLILIILSYFYNNLPIFTGESMFQYYWTQRICDYIGIHKTVDYEDAVFYNMGYDKMLIPAVRYKDSEVPDTFGVSCITDRRKLLRFLQLLKKTDKYKYVIVDVLFDESTRSEYDDTIFSLVKGMPNVVFADDINVKHSCPELRYSGKSGLVNYYTTKVSTNFGRMEYCAEDSLGNNLKSLPLVVYENTNPKKRIKKYGLGKFSIYTMDGKLCQNSVFLRFDTTFVQQVKKEKLNDLNVFSNKYENLNFIDNLYLTEYEKEQLLGAKTKNKYVVIGDFVSDIHDTYIGTMPGSIIMMRALSTLEEGGNIVKIPHIMLWFFVFVTINFVIINNKPISKYIPVIKRIPYHWVHFCLSLISFGTILIIVSIIEYIYDYQVFSLIVPIIYFSIMKMYVQYINQNNYV